MHDANLPETIGVARFQNDTQAGLITTPTPCANADNVMIERPKAPAPTTAKDCACFSESPTQFKLIA